MTYYFRKQAVLLEACRASIRSKLQFWLSTLATWRITVPTAALKISLASNVYLERLLTS